MSVDRQADCIVIGKQRDTFYITIAEAGGPVTAFAMNEAVYRGLVLRIAEVELTEARERVRKPLDDNSR